MLVPQSRSSGHDIHCETTPLKRYTGKQKIIVRSSAEAELYAAVLGASESKGIASLLMDLGHEMKPGLATDAKATERTLHRQGIGKLKQIDVGHTCGCKMKSDPRGCECEESRVRKTLQISVPNRSNQ